MDLRQRHQFPNWALALEFLKRSPFNILLSDEYPTKRVPKALKRRVVLRGVDGGGRYLSMPADVSMQVVERICGALLEDSEPSELDFSTVRSSNFVAFLDRYTQVLAGKFRFTDVAQAISDSTSKLFEADGVSILIPALDGSFRFEVVTAESPKIAERLDQLVVPGDRGVTGWVVANRRAILINADNRDNIINPEVDRHTRFKTREVLACPIMVGSEIIGVLQVVSKRNGAFKKSDLQILVLVAAIIASFMDKARLYEERIKLAKVHKEMEIARELQLAMMPFLPFQFGPFVLKGESKQISRVGGDFWDVLELNNQEALMILGDVSGHGLSAALVMSAVRTASRALMPRLNSPHELIAPLNLLLHNEFGVKGHYATMIFIHLDLNQKKVQYLRAGHEYPIHSSEKELTRLQHAGSWPLGLFPFRQGDLWHNCPLEQEDRLYLYTDGVTDGLDEEEPRMEELLREHPFLRTALEQGTFFKTLQERLNWKAIDDATMLQLSLT